MGDAGLKFFYLVAGGLAAFRLSLLISKEDGPAYLFRKIRNLPASPSAKEVCTVNGACPYGRGRLWPPTFA